MTSLNHIKICVESQRLSASKNILSKNLINKKLTLQILMNTKLNCSFMQIDYLKWIFTFSFYLVIRFLSLGGKLSLLQFFENVYETFSDNHIASAFLEM